MQETFGRSDLMAHLEDDNYTHYRTTDTGSFFSVPEKYGDLYTKADALGRAKAPAAASAVEVSRLEELLGRLDVSVGALTRSLRERDESLSRAKATESMARVRHDTGVVPVSEQRHRDITIRTCKLSAGVRQKLSYQFAFSGMSLFAHPTLYQNKFILARDAEEWTGRPAYVAELGMFLFLGETELEVETLARRAMGLQRF